MKYRYIIPFLFAFAYPAYADDIGLDNKEILKLIYQTKADEVNKALSEGDFFIHAKSIEYSLMNGQEGMIIDWEGPSPGLTGKVVIIAVDNKTLCKTFTQSITIKGQTFDGMGMGCLVDGRWVIKPMK